MGPINSFNLIWGPQIIEANLVEVAILGGLDNLCVDLQRKKSAHSIIEKSGPFLLLRKMGIPSSLGVEPHLCGHRRIGQGRGGHCPH